MVLSLSSCFWGADGFNVIEERTSQTKECMMQWGNMMRKRAKIEELYAIELQNMLSEATGLIEYGTTRSACSVLFSEVEAAIKRSHNLSEFIINSCVNPIQSFEADMNKSRREQLEVAWVAKSENEKLHRSYLQAVSTHDELKGQLDTASQLRSSSTFAIDERSTLIQKDLNAAKRSAAITAEKLSSDSESFRLGLQNAFDALEEHELERIVFLKEQLTIFVNALCQSAEKEVELRGRIRDSVSVITPRYDVEAFIASRKTGTMSKFSPVLQTPTEMEDDTVGDKMSVAVDRRQEELPPIENENKEIEIEFIGTCKATHKYIGRDRDELDLQEGDLLNIVEKHSEAWWIVERQGRLGLVPSSFISES
ncbi:SH3 domain-containing protein [Planoprotostelium fungivorum]|uniref:SH3 domain-containing protein n=1 Tax=Planoprotostelium fungivorum TaxID=1890364 RepID=A0A2P6MX06_9EUKA|nr:SH3 domain-containing protein [Planoprotostelium fungivorum]